MIVKKRGQSFVPVDMAKDIKEIVFHWGWILPRNGQFSIDDLITAIKLSYSQGNTRVISDISKLSNLKVTNNEHSLH